MNQVQGVYPIGNVWVRACVYCPTSIQIAKQMRLENGQEVMQRARARRSSYSSMYAHTHIGTSVCYTTCIGLSNGCAPRITERSESTFTKQSTPASKQIPTREQNTPQTTAAIWDEALRISFGKLQTAAKTASARAAD